MRSSRTAYGVAAALWVLLIYLSSTGVVTTGQLARGVSAAAGGRISESGFAEFWRVVWWAFVKGWHAIEFGALFLLLRQAIGKAGPAALVATAFGVLDEIHQVFVPARGGRASDMLIDAAGVIAAYAFVEGWFRQRRWLGVPFVLLIVGAIFGLSLYPFGLMDLPNGRLSPSGQPRP